MGLKNFSRKDFKNSNFIPPNINLCQELRQSQILTIIELMRYPYNYDVQLYTVNLATIIIYVAKKNIYSLVQTKTINTILVDGLITLLRTLEKSPKPSITKKENSYSSINKKKEKIATQILDFLIATVRFIPVKHKVR
jgi:hypothetical protein